jgi:polyisoprenoid-binding protein YceI
MFRNFGFASLLSFLISIPAFAEKGVEIAVTLSPAGSYVARAKVTGGTAYKTADGVAAENVTVDLNSITTGIALRDKHTKERLKAAEHPEAKLVKASGKDGKGTATLALRGQTYDVSGTYEVKGDALIAKFPVNIKELGINDAKYMGVGVKDVVNVTRGRGRCRS